VNVCYGSPSGHTIESNIELAFDPPELSRWQRFWRSGWGIATAFVALIAAVLILPLKALAVAAVFVAVSLGIGGVIAGVRSSNRGSGFWDGLGRFITDNWSSSVALGMGLSLVSFGVGKAAAWIAKAASKKQVASAKRELFVIGENMQGRVELAAQNFGADVYGGLPNYKIFKAIYGAKKATKAGYKHNKKWIKQKMKEGAQFFDIGSEGLLPTSKNYKMELKMLKKYPHVITRLCP